MSSRIQYRGEAASLLSRGAATVCSPGRKPGVDVVLRSSPVGAKDSRESVAPTVLTLERAEIPGLAPGATLLSPLRGFDRMRFAHYFGQQWSMTARSSCNQRNTGCHRPPLQRRIQKVCRALCDEVVKRP